MVVRALLLAIGLTRVLIVPGAGAAPGPTAFQSPSGNIGCYLDTAGARCDIRAHDWRTPARPKGCGLQVGAKSAKGSFVCAGDTALGSGCELAYGRSIARGGLRCTSRSSGMTCRNARGCGFVLSRQAVRRF